MSSYPYAETFTRAHARRLAGRVTTDLRQSHLLYVSPSESMLEKYRTELEELLTGGYVDRYQFGFKRRASRLVTALCRRAGWLADRTGNRRRRPGRPERPWRDVLQLPHLLGQLVREKRVALIPP